MKIGNADSTSLTASDATLPTHTSDASLSDLGRMLELVHRAQEHVALRLSVMKTISSRHAGAALATSHAEMQLRLHCLDEVERQLLL